MQSRRRRIALPENTPPLVGMHNIQASAIPIAEASREN